jgi:MraZ protein
MFTGQYYHAMDDKGRIKFPKPLLKALKMKGSSGLMLSKVFNSRCLCILPTKDWLTFVRNVQETLPPEADKQAVTRFFGAGAMPCNIDELGRLLIPPPLKEYAHFKKDVVIVGLFDRIELWDKETWTHYCEMNFDTVSETIEKVDQPKLPEFRLIRGSDKTN